MTSDFYYYNELMLEYRGASIDMRNHGIAYNNWLKDIETRFPNNNLDEPEVPQDEEEPEVIPDEEEPEVIPDEEEPEDKESNVDRGQDFNKPVASRMPYIKNYYSDPKNNHYIINLAIKNGLLSPNGSMRDYHNAMTYAWKEIEQEAYKIANSDKKSHHSNAAEFNRENKAIAVKRLLKDIRLRKADSMIYNCILALSKYHPDIVGGTNTVQHEVFREWCYLAGVR